MAALGLTDPREWSGTSWASDLVPYVAFGPATVLADGSSDHIRIPFTTGFSTPCETRDCLGFEGPYRTDFGERLGWN
jgi:hypothetical protein